MLKTFKGTVREYDRLHAWVRRELGRPKLCSMCGLSDSSRRYEWANRSGEYLRDLTDWIRVCVPCHHKMDGHNPNTGKRTEEHSRNITISKYGYDPALIPQGHKRCPTCKTVKPVTEFYKRGGDGGTGYVGKCKPCECEYSKQRYNAKKGIV